MFDDLSFCIGATNRAHVVVRPTRRENPQATDPHDYDWVSASVEVAAGAFCGTYEVALDTGDFVRFRDGLRVLYRELVGTALFDTVEGWLRIEVIGDGRGHFRARCNATDEPQFRNRLTFDVECDQTEIPEVLLSLDAICEAFDRHRGVRSTDVST